MLAGLTTQIGELDDAITTAALGHPDAPRLITRPGVGALTALTTIVVLGPVSRLHDSKHVVSYVGLAVGRQHLWDSVRLHGTDRSPVSSPWVRYMAPARL